MKNSFDFSAKEKYYNLSPKQSKARFDLLNYAINHPGCITKKDAISVIACADHAEAADILQFFIENGMVALNADGDLERLYPLSCVETPHKVVLQDGRSYFAMCAIDALGAASTFGMQARIFSFCKDTNESVEAIVNKDGIVEITPSDLYVSYYDIWSSKEDNFNFCCMMNFFRYKESVDKYLKSFENDDDMYLWNVDDAFKAATEIFRVCP